MRLRLAFVAAQSMGLFLAPSEAFTPAAWRRTTSPPSRSIATVIGVSAADADEGDDSNLEDAELSDEMKEKLKQEDENFGGGSRFKDMMAKAQARQGAGGGGGGGISSQGIRNPFADNPYKGIEGLDPDATPPAAAPAAAADTPSFDNMTVEQQAQMFRAMMQGQQMAAPAAPAESQQQRDDRKVGRNRDADTIQNTADVYFAQLKRDSTVRGIARIRGDEDGANAVFQDEKIEELKDLIHKNPHLAGQREEEMKLIEAAAEEALAFQKALETPRGNPASTGISYKEKLAQRQKKTAGGGGVAAAAAPAAPVESPPPPAEPKPVAAEAPPAPVQEEKPAVASPAASVAPPAPPQPAEPQQQAAPTTPAASPASPQQSAPAAASGEWGSPDEIRRGLRTLMGLILKHRGGPGFGAGGLKGDEIGAYQQLMEEVTALLREEAQKQHTGPTTAVAVEQPEEPVAAPAPAPATPVAPAQVGAEGGGGATAGLATVPHSPSDSAQVESVMACIEGAILMYKNSPEELKEGVLMTVRAALLSAVNTCNKVLGQNEGIPTGAAGAGSSIDSMFACVEGAIKMYRNSPPELQQGVLLTVRAALLSAIGACNKMVAENDVQNFQQYQETTAELEKPATTSKPTQFYDVVQVPAEEDAQETAAGVDGNTVVLENIYNKLEAAVGNGRMGLREGLSSQEASELADSIVEMRSIILDELDNGIPEAAAAPAAIGDSSSSDSASIYQKMLAQARAKKEANA